MKARKGNMDVGELIIIAVIVLAAIGGFIVYCDHSRKKEESERRAAEIAREKQEQAEREERERRLKEEEAFERKRREARLAREREEAEKEALDRERKRLAAEAEAEQRRKAAEAEGWRTAYQVAKDRFSTVFCFAKDVLAKDKPRSVTEQRTFWCAFLSALDEKRIYEIKAEPGGRIGVVVLTADAASAPISTAEFLARMKGECAAIVSDTGKAYLIGVDLPVDEAYSIPPKGQDFRIAETCLRDVYSAIVELGLQVPNPKFRVRLKSDNGKTNIDMGELGFRETLERARLERALGEKLSTDAKKSISQKPEIKKKKMRRTAKLYDGKYIKKGMDGVTLVPRVFEFVGTTNYKTDDFRARNDFRRKWEALHAQALREDEEERQMEEEHQAALGAEMAAKGRALARASAIAGDDCAIEGALATCKLHIKAMEAKKTAEVKMKAAYVKCPDCNGAKLTKEEVICPKCDGQGQFEKVKLGLNGTSRHTVSKCSNCQGKGVVTKSTRCERCKGTGRVQDE